MCRTKNQHDNNLVIEPQSKLIEEARKSINCLSEGSAVTGSVVKAMTGRIPMSQSAACLAELNESMKKEHMKLVSDAKEMMKGAFIRPLDR